MCIVSVVGFFGERVGEMILLSHRGSAKAAGLRSRLTWIKTEAPVSGAPFDRNSPIPNLCMLMCYLERPEPFSQLHLHCIMCVRGK
jgi:hypothetical protein